MSDWTAPLVTKFVSSHGPALAALDNKLYMSWKGAGNDERIWFTIINGSPWYVAKQAPGVWTSDGPAMAPYMNKIFMAWKGMGDDGRIWHTTFNGAMWAAQTPVPGALTSCRPAVAVYDGKLFLAWKGAGNDGRCWYTTFDGTKWAAQKLIPGVCTSHSPSMAAGKGKLLLVWKGAGDDARIWHKAFDGVKWGTYVKDGGESVQAVTGCETSCGPAVAEYNNAPLAGPKPDFIYINRIIMVFKGKDAAFYTDDRLMQSDYFGEYSTPAQDNVTMPRWWSSPSYVGENHGASDTPALASFDGKLYMAWKWPNTPDARIRYSYLHVPPLLKPW